MKVRPARYWEEKVMVRVGMTLSQLVSLVGKNPAVHNCSSAATAASPSPHLSLNRMRRTKKWQPMFSWIWYGPVDRLLPRLLDGSRSCLLFLFFPMALPRNSYHFWKASKNNLIALPPLILWLARSCLYLSHANQELRKASVASHENVRLSVGFKWRDKLSLICQWQKCQGAAATKSPLWLALFPFSSL